MAIAVNGSTGLNVADLQRRLTALGYQTGSVDGQFGPTTQSALQAYQTANGITPDGMYGPETEQAMAQQGAAVGQQVENPAVNYGGTPPESDPQFLAFQRAQ